MRAAPPSQPESAYAWLRLAASLALMTISGVGMYAVAVVLPAVQAEFGVSRSGASLPYAATMIGFGVGGLRPAGGRHLAVVHAPARHRGGDLRERQLPRRRALADTAAALHRDRRLARDLHRRRPVL